MCSVYIYMPLYAARGWLLANSIVCQSYHTDIGVFGLALPSGFLKSGRMSRMSGAQTQGMILKWRLEEK